MPYDAVDLPPVDAVEAEETEEEYRLRVYGAPSDDDDEKCGTDNADFRRSASLRRRLSRRLSSELARRRSSVAEQLPDTPRGWAVLLSILGSVLVGYEVSLQRRLTCPPIVYGQVRHEFRDQPLPSSEASLLPAVYAKLTATRDAILTRPIQPSLLIGTRALLSSVAAYLFRGPSTSADGAEGGRVFREVLTMTQDGAKLALDWELPEPTMVDDGRDTGCAIAQLRQSVLQGSIPCKVVVLILHGINNDAGFGYVRSLRRACCRRGWLGCGLNFRGCGAEPLATPRSYTGAYTGDLRNVVWQIAARLPPDGKLFLVGHSLGANLVTKYLGEEGLSGTLPRCVAGGVSLGNPLSLRSDRIDPVMSSIMAMGVKKTLVENWSSLRHMNDRYFRQCIRKALLAPTLQAFDTALAPIFARNEPEYPFASRIGYESAEAYWNDASSFIRSPHIPVPTMLLIAADDFLVFHASRGRLQFCLNNPNVLVVETKCGGHLGWQESPPNGGFGGVLGTSWSDVATTDFIAAVLEADEERQRLQPGAEDSTRRLRSRL